MACESTPLTEGPTQCFFFLSPFSECKETLSHVFNEIKTFPGYTRVEPQTNRKWENPYVFTNTHANIPSEGALTRPGHATRLPPESTLVSSSLLHRYKGEKIILYAIYS